MTTLYSNELKAVVAHENFLENPMNVMKENCLTLQHFDYRCEHKRNEAGIVYGVTSPVILNFTIRVSSPRHFQPYYRALNSNAPQHFSFIFNATYNANKRLAEFEDGMVVDGYVVNIEEKSAEPTQQGEDRQTQLTVTLQVRSITYSSTEHDITSTFIQ